jgi:hypothetical protein
MYNCAPYLCAYLDELCAVVCVDTISRGGLLGEVELWVIKVKPGNPDKSIASLKVAFHEVISRSLETHLNAFTKSFLM